MPKVDSTHDVGGGSAFLERRRLRRIRMIIELTANVLESEKALSHREAKSLVSCARRAVAEILPEFEEKFDLLIVPRFERLMASRWPYEQAFVARHQRASELVN